MEPEVALWRAVVLRAVHDAAGQVETSCLPDDDERSRQEIIAEAQKWISEAGEGFRLICDAAGFVPDYVRKMAVKQFAQERAA